MATVYKETYTRPLPEGAELFTRKGKRFARWTDAKGKKRTEPVTKDGTRIVLQAKTYTAKYRDGQRIVRKVSTGCRDETAARAVLAELVKRSEHVRSGIMTSEQDAMADHQHTPLADHVEAWLSHLRAKGVTEGRIKTNRQRFFAVADDCRSARLAELSGDALERWLVNKADKGMSAGASNGYREACVGFGNWCIRTRRLSENPFANVPKANTKLDCRRKRRAMTEEELVRLIDAARRRPLLEAMTIRRGKDRGKAMAEVKPETRWQLEALGRERALTYKTLALTGLRKRELASLTVGQVELDGPRPTARLRAADEKNRQGSEIALRADLAADLRQWLADKLEARRDACRACCEALPSHLPPETPILEVPTGLVRILDRDLTLAGIPKRDDRGRTIDVHALRMTFGTHLSKGGVPLRTAQAAMRHSDPSLTANIYTDPRLLDVRAALDALPSLPLDGQPRTEQQKMTGTDGVTPPPRNLVPNLVPDFDDSGKRGTIAGKAALGADRDGREHTRRQVVENAKERRPLPSADKGRHKSEREDLNLRPLRPERSALSKLSYAPCHPAGGMCVRAKQSNFFCRRCKL